MGTFKARAVRRTPDWGGHGDLTFMCEFGSYWVFFRVLRKMELLAWGHEVADWKWDFHNTTEASSLF
jgi:hypothetical protein